MFFLRSPALSASTAGLRIDRISWPIVCNITQWRITLPEARIIAAPISPPTSAVDTNAHNVSHWAQPGPDAGHQLDVTRSHAADRIER